MESSQPIDIRKGQPRSRAVSESAQTWAGQNSPPAPFGLPWAPLSGSLAMAYKGGILQRTQSESSAVSVSSVGSPPDAPMGAPGAGWRKPLSMASLGGGYEGPASPPPTSPLGSMGFFFPSVPPRGDDGIPAQRLADPADARAKSPEQMAAEAKRSMRRRTFSSPTWAPPVTAPMQRHSLDENSSVLSGPGAASASGPLGAPTTPSDPVDQDPMARMALQGQLSMEF